VLNLSDIIFLQTAPHTWTRFTVSLIPATQKYCPPVSTHKVCYWCKQPQTGHAGRATQKLSKYFTS